MIKKNIIATTELDRHNQRIPLYKLNRLSKQFSEDDSAVRFIVNHDSTVLPLGKIISGEVIEINDKVSALKVEFDDFAKEFKPIVGPNGELLYFAESKYDSRPFAEHEPENFENLSVEINPYNFNPNDFDSLKKYIQEDCEIQVETVVKKSFVPDPEFIFYLTSGIFLPLVCKKMVDKLCDGILDSVVVGIKKAVLKLSSKIKKNSNSTYIITGIGQSMEFAVQTNNPDILFTAFRKIREENVVEEIENFISFFNSDIRKIQFLYNVEDEKWELNYITTSSGQVIGTEKCYKRAIYLYDKIDNNPTSGLSISGSTSIVEENNNA